MEVLAVVAVFGPMDFIVVQLPLLFFRSIEKPVSVDELSRQEMLTDVLEAGAAVRFVGAVGAVFGGGVLPPATDRTIGALASTSPS